MKKHVSLFCFLIGFVSFAMAQTLDVDWGPFNNLEKGDNIEKMLGADKEGYYILKSNRAGSLFLEYFNGTTNTVESSKELLMPSIQGVTSTYEKMFYMGGNLILYTSINDENRKQKICYVQYINKDGTLNNKPKEIGAIPPSNGKDGFNVFTFEEHSKILLEYHKTFTKYSGEPLAFKIFDPTLTELFNKNLELPLKDREFTIQKYLLGKSGDLYMLIKAEVVSTKKAAATAPKVYEFIVLHYNAKKDEFKSYNLTLQKNPVHSATMVLDEKEEIVIMGFMGKKSQPDMTGAFYKRINPRTYKFLQVDPKLEAVPFTSEMNMEFRKERNLQKDGKPEDVFSFDLNQIVFLKNGTAILVAEYTMSTLQIIQNPTTKTEERFTQHFYNDIVVAAADKDGKMLWIKRICKNQFSRDDDGRWGSYAIAAEGNQVKFIMNDHPKNIKENTQNGDKIKQTKEDDGQAIVLTVFQDGSFEKSPMFKDDDAKTSTSARLLLKTKDAYFVFCQKGNKYKFGRFFFQ
ncbi:MAG: hypothetical protein A2275_11585 [Bacteroidetes bacterium RIFOXYA12_FULL_35_11]|nr:MAG: hypothetical protein A2X01_18980 [Bacteroidetes bacterium GWF2_35_48]OFY72588.1 MAG: hypothetical protein A2275_11585 [Bacteroidetes bacterium RIFOXYA12_FULL_35_11]OFY95702.1 MAG: hypothetical protein A2491_08830 [Bacteroidetes bacterium RIFOXYC12_FULL_35_7]HBX49568.1 hypothetical protein [Bacteroidales bacterium]